MDDRKFSEKIRFDSRTWVGGRSWKSLFYSCELQRTWLCKSFAIKFAYFRDYTSNPVNWRYQLFRWRSLGCLIQILSAKNNRDGLPCLQKICSNEVSTQNYCRGDHDSRLFFRTFYRMIGVFLWKKICSSCRQKVREIKYFLYHLTIQWQQHPWHHRSYLWSTP
jgi:hypothetical protein